MTALIPLLRYLFVTAIDSVIIYFFIIGQFLLGFIIGVPFVLGIVIYYIFKKDNNISKHRAFIFAICVAFYVFLSFISHSLVNNQSVEFLKDILTGIELPLALALISESSTESNPKNDNQLSDINHKITQLLATANSKNNETSPKINDKSIALLTEVSNGNNEKLTEVNDKITQLLTMVDNKNNEHSPEVNDTNIELVTENKTRKKFQTRRIMQIKKLHKNNRLTNIKR